MKSVYPAGHEGSRVASLFEAKLEPGTSPFPRHRPLVSVKDLLWFLYLYPLRFLASRMGAKSLRLLGRAAEPLFQVLAGSRRRMARERMARAFGAKLDGPAIDAMSRRFVSNAVRRALDDLCLADPDAAARLTPPEIRGLGHLNRALSAGKGVVLISGHFYANRLGKHLLARAGYPMMSVRNGEPPDEWMGRLGARFLQPRYIRFLHGIIADEVFIQDPQCSLRIFRRLRAGGMVNVHIDASFSPHRVELPFLGATWPFATGLLEIARLSGCAVIPMLCLGDQLASSVTFEESLALTPAGGRDDFVSLNIEKFVRSLERQILNHGDQWEMWMRL